MKSEANGPQVYVIPCSGIGKPTASVAREATYRVIEDLRPGVADTLCLSLLTMGDAQTAAAVASTPCITVDGCPRLCARKNVELAGGQVCLALRVPDLLREHPGLTPAAVLEIGPQGEELADRLAAMLAHAIDGLVHKEDSVVGRS